MSGAGDSARLLRARDVEVGDVLDAAGYLFCCPENLASMSGEQVDIPLIIGGEEVRTGNTMPVPVPHDHGLKLGVAHKAGAAEVAAAIEAASAARRDWERMPWQDRAAIFLRVGELLAGLEVDDRVGLQRGVGHAPAQYGDSDHRGLAARRSGISRRRPWWSPPAWQKDARH